MESSSPLKYSLLDESAEVCLITKDPHQPYKEIVRSQDISYVTKVNGQRVGVF